jgi:hypothetical protein
MHNKSRLLFSSKTKDNRLHCRITQIQPRRDACRWPDSDARSRPALGGDGVGLSRAPCVGWVVGVWFGFALRCVAVLCGVFVRLHLALFPAGGPFLPSLSVNINPTINL